MAAWECRNCGQVISDRCGVDAGGFEDLPDGGGRDVVAEAREFAMDAAAAPGWVPIGKARNNLSVLGGGGRSSRSPFGLCPVAGDA